MNMKDIVFKYAKFFPSLFILILGSMLVYSDSGYDVVGILIMIWGNNIANRLVNDDKYVKRSKGFK